jgi:hypothetical protein
VERRKAISFAAAVSLVGASGVFAVGASFGLFGVAGANTPPIPALPVADVSRAGGATMPASAPAASPPDTIQEFEVIDVPVYVPGSAATATPPAAAEPMASGDLPDEESAEPLGDDPAQATSANAPAGASATAVSEAPGDRAGAREVEPCEVHDDGLVECHEHEDD